MKLRQSAKDDSGAFAVLFAIMFIAIVGLSALVTDVGYWYASKRQLQTAADAAALAGCQDLAHGMSNGAIWATAEDYAGRNFGTPLTLAECTVVPPSANGLSDIGSNFVKVTVESNSPAFLSRVLGRTTTLIQAQSIARIGYITGARSPAPWGVPLLQATRVEVSAGGGPFGLLTEQAGGLWTGAIPTGSLGEVLVRAFNDQTLDPAYPDGVPEDAEGAGYVVRIPDTAPFTAISTARLTDGTEYPGSMVFTSGSADKVVVYVTVGSPLAAGQSLAVTRGNQDIAMTAITSTLYRAQFAPPTTTDLQESFVFGVKQKKAGSTLYDLDPAGRFLVRRSTFPISDITLQPSALTSTTTGPVQVTVKLNDYEYGRRYELKVTGGGAEVGNFMAVDFSTLHHPPYWTQQDPVEYPAMPNGTSVNYYPYIEGNPGFNFVMHVGDAVWTEPGNLSGPQTRNALLERFGGEPSNFEAWEAAGKPESNRLVLVPVVEKIQEATGQTPLRVISFATFYVEDVVVQGGDVAVTGLFVEYTAPSLDVVDDPPGPFAVQAVHLSAEGLDF
ncbi:MAG TPA: pilus assembly protein TadG-related protein [Coriobacteriia bacterium]|nr:pilus assembly protein TadG-related protein [Coriobacteriia bacterium]